MQCMHAQPQAVLLGAGAAAALPASAVLLRCSQQVQRITHCVDEALRELGGLCSARGGARGVGAAFVAARRVARVGARPATQALGARGRACWPAARRPR